MNKIADRDINAVGKPSSPEMGSNKAKLSDNNIRGNAPAVVFTRNVLVTD